MEALERRIPNVGGTGGDNDDTASAANVNNNTNEVLAHDRSINL